MPRYYFNVHDGYSAVDEEGTELPDRVSARREAIRLAGRILDDEAHKIGLGEDWRIEVIDERGEVLFLLALHVTEMRAEDRPETTAEPS